MMGKYTKGKVTAEVAKMRADQPAFGFTIRIEGKKPPICGLGVYQPDVATVSPEYRKICPEYFTPEEIEANAALISEAFNVAHETGLTPRQLAGQRERLMACLRAEVADLKSRMFGSTHWQGCEEAHPKCAALKRMQNAIAEAEGATP